MSDEKRQPSVSGERWTCPICDPSRIGTVNDPNLHEYYTGHACEQITVPYEGDSR